MGGMGFTGISKKLATSNGNIFFMCPGCDAPHGINCGEGHGPVWGWDRELEKPTFTPSVHVSYNRGDTEYVCHSFIRNGQFVFLNDCTHEYAGMTVDIPDWEQVETIQPIDRYPHTKYKLQV